MHTTTATITAKYVNQPKEGRNWGSVKDENLGYIGVKKEHLGQFTQGNTYTIEYEQKGDFKGFVRIIDQAQQQPQQTAARPSSNTAKEIFVTGVVGRAMGSGKFGPQDITTLTTSAKAAWEQAFEGKKVAPPDDISYPTDDAPFPSPEDYQ